MQPFSCQHRDQYISKRNYEITVVILWRRFIFPDENYEVGPLNLFFPFLKYTLGSVVWLIPFRDHVKKIFIFFYRLGALRFKGGKK
jgi:hypothetical protein